MEGSAQGDAVVIEGGDGDLGRGIDFFGETEAPPRQASPGNPFTLFCVLLLLLSHSMLLAC